MQNSIDKKFFELLRISIGTQQQLTEPVPIQDWELIYKIVLKQSLAGVMFAGLEKVISQTTSGKPSVLLDWFSLHVLNIKENNLQKKRAKELYEIFLAGGFKSCVLKGMGTAKYYDRPELRQSGDIDLWVEGARDEIVKYAKSRNVYVESVDIKDSTMYFFDDVLVEVHFRPNCMFSPFKDKKLQSFFKEMAPMQFSAFDESLGFAHTTIEFDLVYSLVHIYRHIFSEGIGVRPFVDYFYILKNSDCQQRTQAYDILCGLGMKDFSGGCMFILQEKLGMSSKFALCGVNKRHGEFLLNEIMLGGNFGHFDPRYHFAAKDKKFRRGVDMLKRNMHFAALYPSEVLWSPIWKMWHYCWRKQKGYL